MTCRLALLPLCIAGALGLGACGSSSSSSAGASTASSSQTAARGAYGPGAAASSSGTATATSSGTATATSSGTATASSPGTAAAAGRPAAVASAADPTGALKFVENKLSARAGTVTIDFTNRSSLGHNFTLQKGTSGPILGATPTFRGGLRTLTVHLAPGTYTFFCSVPGHRMAGMQGTLTVR